MKTEIVQKKKTYSRYTYICLEILYRGCSWTAVPNYVAVSGQSGNDGNIHVDSQTTHLEQPSDTVNTKQLITILADFINPTAINSYDCL